MHPAADGAALGMATLHDFRLFSAMVKGMHPGGVYINWGSAVVLPEVFLKAVSVVRNLGVPLRPDHDGEFRFRAALSTVAKCSEAPYRRCIAQNENQSRGYAITGHHEIRCRWWPRHSQSVALPPVRKARRTNDDLFRRFARK